MKTTTHRSSPGKIALLFAIGSAVAMTLAGCQGVQVDERADEVLRAMGAKLAAADQFTIRAKRSIDAALIEGRDVPESAEVSISVKRPSKFAGTLVGKDAERRVYYDGKTLSMFAVKKKLYATVPAPDTIDGLMAKVEEKFGFSPPVAEFIAADPYREMLKGALVGKYLGEVDLAGKKCHHLAFKEELLDWDLWVSADDHLPVKFVITATAIEGRPKVEMEFAEFNLDATLPDELFEFKPPHDARKIEMLTAEETEELEELAD